MKTETETLKKNILFVDDDPNFLTGLFRALRQMSSEWEMNSANSVDEALVFMGESLVDVVITDFRMDGKNGLDLLCSITQSDKLNSIPVVMLTGSDEADLKRRAIEMGAADLLGKPVVREDLIARIKSVLRLKESQDALRSMNQTLELRVKDRTAELEQSRLEMIWRLAKAGEFRDEVTGNHVYRVAHYCKIIGEALGQNEQYVRHLFLTSPLHDIGKIGIPDAILGKKGKLDVAERSIVQQHCEIGWRILSLSHYDINPLDIYSYSFVIGTHAENELVEMAATIALCHHEKWDGSGYPRGLMGDKIPLEARIVAVADVYDALSDVRPYKPAYPAEQVIETMKQLSGSHFSPEVFEAMCHSLDAINEIRCRLEDNPADLQIERVA